MISSVSLCLMMLAISPAGAGAPFADSVHVPPVAEKEAAAQIDPETLAKYIEQLQAYRVFNPFEGQNEALKTKYAPALGGPLRSGEVVPVDLSSDQLFGPPIVENGTWVYEASITSVDAQAIRLRADLSQLDPDAEVWMVDPLLPRAFGPYTAGRDGTGPRWLATIQGEEAVLLVRTPRAGTPRVRLVEYSHIFVTFADIEKNLSCNVNIECETDPDVLSVATGTAIILVGGEWYCSGTLVNNPQTAEFEPFFLTANHCICTRQEARDTETFWDYRSTACGVNDPPDLDTLPRSTGEALLATDPALDTTLIRLNSVASGVYGRTYVGWDTRDPVVGEGVYGIHYPDATHMRISKGAVIALDQSQGGRNKLTKVHWDEGVTEAGSSGSCLLFKDNNRILGALSQGPQHTCGPDRSGNVDWFGSFRDFYSEVKPFIDTATPSAQEAEDNCRQTNPLCPFSIAFADQPQVLDELRTVRDKFLMTHTAGRDLVHSYYTIAPRLADAVQASPTIRNAFIAATRPIARIASLCK